MSADDSDPKISPWAARFGPHPSNWSMSLDGTRHSRMAPHFPDRDPAKYLDVLEEHEIVPTNVLPLPQPSDAELDDLYYTERTQQKLFRGPKSRQLGVINTHTYHKPGGHTNFEDPHVVADQFDVHESTWLECFQRHRWYFPEVIPYMVPDKHVQALSVDLDEVWNVVRPAFELANRVLGLLCEEQNPHLDALLYGIIWAQEPLQPGEHKDSPGRVMLPVPTDRNLPGRHDDRRMQIFIRDLQQRASTALLKKELASLTRNVMWTFLDEHDNRNGNSASGDTVPLNHTLYNWGPILCTISTTMTRGILENKATWAEKCNGTFCITATILHELVHAIWRQRCHHRGAEDEPFIGLDRFAELGSAFENAIWGGRIWGIGGHPFKADGAFHGIMMSVVCNKWPDAWEKGTYARAGSQLRTIHSDEFKWAENAKQVSWTIPALWISWLFTKEFWEVVVPTYGTMALKQPMVFGAFSYVWRFGYRTFNLIATDPELGPEYFKHQARTLRHNFYAQEWKNQNMRPWQTLQKARWELSPWSWDDARDMINDFTLYHAQRNLKKAVSEAARLHVGAIMAFQTDMRKNNGQSPSSATYWIFKMIAILMFASLPVESLEASDSGERFRTQEPTIALVNADIDRLPAIYQQINPLTAQRKRYSRKRIPEFDIQYPADYQPITHPWDWWPKIQTELANYGRGGGITHWSWLHALSSAGRAMRKDREANPAADHWAAWTFEVPVYRSARSWAHQDVATQKWKQYEGNIDFLAHFFPSPMQYLPTMPHPEPPPPLALLIPPPAGELLPVSQEIIDNEQIPHPVVDPTAPKEDPTPEKPVLALGSKKRSVYTRDRYYTISHAADSGWIVEHNPQDGTMDVYDLQALLYGPGWEHINFEDITECGPYGRQLLPTQQELRSLLKNPQMRFRVGKIFPNYRLAEVVEFDGSGDMPAWVLVGDQYRSNDEKDMQLLQRSAGGSLRPDGKQDLELLPNIVQNIRDYQIGFLLDETGQVPHGEPRSLYTLSMLRRYDNPKDGMYTAIDGYVYDLEPYLESHPGGAETLKYVCGRDGTKEFSVWHPLNLLQGREGAPLRIGRLVGERSVGNIQDDEVVIHDHVFNIQAFLAKDSDLRDVMKPLGGSDVSYIVTGRDEDREQAKLKDLLTWLYLKHKNLITAAVLREPKVREYSTMELRQRNNPQDVAWVAVDDDIFDVSPILLHRECYENNPGLRLQHAGRRINSDGPIAHWLREEQSHRIVGKLARQHQDERHDSVSTIDLENEEEERKVSFSALQTSPVHLTPHSIPGSELEEEIVRTVTQDLFSPSAESTTYEAASPGSHQDYASARSIWTDRNNQSSFPGDKKRKAADDDDNSEAEKRGRRRTRGSPFDL